MKKILYLVGDFEPASLARWKQWAEATHQVIETRTMEELDAFVYGENPVIIMDSHGLNDAPLPK